MTRGVALLPLVLLLMLVLPRTLRAQAIERRLGSMQEVFAWTQLTYEINGQQLLRDRFGEDDEVEEQTEATVRLKRQAQERGDRVFFNNNQRRPDAWNTRPSQQQPSQPTWGGQQQQLQQLQQEPQQPSWGQQQSTTTARPANESGRFFIQYNNVPMGVERVGSRLFITVPRRRYGIPATLNYLDLRRDSARRSPALRPYPDLRQGASLVSVYRTRADVCGRLWMVDTGLLEIPNDNRQLQPPAIVIFDLKTNRQLLRYPFKSSDIPAANTPAGLASITVEVTAEDCAGATAYVPDLNTNGIIVFSLRERDSWRHQHNYLHFNPTASTLNIAGQRFQWNDGIFSLTLGRPALDGCRAAYFHPLASTQEFSVSTCVLRNRTASQARDYWSLYNLLGDRGSDSQSSMHEFHSPTQVVFFADVGRNAVSCWRATEPLRSTNMAIIAQDSRRLSYPSDLHVVGDEVWVMANTLPRFIYSRLDTNEYNFFIYRGSVQDMIQNTPCANGLSLTGLRSNASTSTFSN